MLKGGILWNEQKWSLHINGLVWDSYAEKNRLGKLPEILIPKEGVISFKKEGNDIQGTITLELEIIEENQVVLDQLLQEITQRLEETTKRKIEDIKDISLSSKAAKIKGIGRVKAYWLWRLKKYSIKYNDEEYFAYNVVLKEGLRVDKLTRVVRLPISFHADMEEIKKLIYRQ